jgi:hypothetical protein
MNAVATIAPVIRISTVALLESLPMLVVEVEIPAAVVIAAVVARIVTMHIAVIIAVLGVSRAGTQREGKYRD